MIDSSIGGLGLNLNLNRVSDDNHWRDFGRASEPLRQRLLPNDAMLSWGWAISAQVRTLKWQTCRMSPRPSSRRMTACRSWSWRTRHPPCPAGWTPVWSWTPRALRRHAR